MSLPGFSAQASLYETNGKYNLHHIYYHENIEIIRPSQFNFECIKCLFKCELICNPILGGGQCIISCPQMCAQECGIIRPLT